MEQKKGFIMLYKKIVKGRFIERPNRFIARVDINGTMETIHVKNTGRCRELLVKDAVVYLSESDNPERKTKYDLIAVEKKREGKPSLLINMDSQAPNAVAEKWLKSGALFSENAVIKREVKYGNSRFDFGITDGDEKAFLEVKGVTLEYDGTAMFPDAPTERGVKHINELIECVNKGYKAYILFVIQMKEINRFKPNEATHKEFAEALRKASKSGVTILAVDTIVTPENMVIDKFVETEL